MIRAGEAVVDIAEYDGAERLADALAVRYRQLKHSTRRTDQTWETAELAGTLRGFAERFKALRRQTAPPVTEKVTFELITNRPIGARILESVSDLAARTVARHPRTTEALEGYAGIGGG